MSNFFEWNKGDFLELFPSLPNAKNLESFIIGLGGQIGKL